MFIRTSPKAFRFDQSAKVLILPSVILMVAYSDSPDLSPGGTNILKDHDTISLDGKASRNVENLVDRAVRPRKCLGKACLGSQKYN